MNTVYNCYCCLIFSGVLARTFCSCTDMTPGYVFNRAVRVFVCSHVSNDRELERSKMISIHPRACPVQSTVIEWTIVIEIYCVESRREPQVSKRIDHCSALMVGSVQITFHQESMQSRTSHDVFVITGIALEGAREYSAAAPYYSHCVCEVWPPRWQTSVVI